MSRIKFNSVNQRREGIARSAQDCPKESFRTAVKAALGKKYFHNANPSKLLLITENK